MESLSAVEVFEQCARRFCATLEAEFGTDAVALRNLREVLLPLYTAAFLLPDRSPEVEVPEDAERIRQHHRAIVQRVQTAGFQDQFWILWDPQQPEPPETLGSSISDCLGDIWLDLKPGLDALDSNRERLLDSVVWHWRFSFQTHWGRHAIEALYAFHFALNELD